MLELGHKKLEVWQLSKTFVILIYKVTAGFPKEELYGITNQLRRAAVSIASNIAEGASRSSTRDRRRYYEIARSSLVEIDTQLEICKVLNYLSADDAQDLSDKLNELFAKVSNLVRSTR